MKTIWVVHQTPASHMFVFVVLASCLVANTNSSIMGYAIYSSAPVSLFKATPEPPGNHRTAPKLIRLDCLVKNYRAAKVFYVKAKAEESSGETTKSKSMVCSNCEGKGAVLCSQCKGSGVNSDDLFGGTFKAGASCWLCGGKKEMLCGDCNGAGFLGGFMSTADTTAE